ncbi:hypothetical protein BKA70DRAFT_1219143 [Coprinopsis sp. MPI-PUGE-AT-0042]|nr:hypothetical protein BKA70DRAFT_1219143 [Coprinopsis sp. MPI-PUGE-AT-0042]
MLTSQTGVQSTSTHQMSGTSPPTTAASGLSISPSCNIVNNCGSNENSSSHPSDFALLQEYLQQGPLLASNLDFPFDFHPTQAAPPQPPSIFSINQPLLLESLSLAGGLDSSDRLSELQRLTQAQAAQLEEMKAQLQQAIQQVSYYRNLYSREQALSEQVMTSLILLRRRHRNSNLLTRAATKATVASSIRADGAGSKAATSVPQRSHARSAEK